MLSQLLIRDASAEDDAAVGELLVDAFVVAYGKKLPTHDVSDHRKAELRDVAKKRSHARVVVAEYGAKVVGTLTLFPPGAEQSRAWLPNSVELRYLATASELHGLGLSTPLLEESERWSRSLGASSLCLHVREGVSGVAALYMKRGYVRDTRGDCVYPPNIVLEAYRLDL